MMTRGAIKLSRIQPALPAHAFKSYSVRYPLSTHWRKATCEEVDCPQYMLGWDTVVDVGTELGQRQYDYITHDRSRSYTMTKEGLTLVRFHYGPGNQPFAGPSHDHRIKVERAPLMLVTGGDWRGNPRGTEPVVHRNAENWVDDLARHQDRLARAQN